MKRPPTNEPLEQGQQVRDRVDQRTGEVIDVACQYAHPKAPPVYSYLIRWQDGQVQALSENALDLRDGIEAVD